MNLLDKFDTVTVVADHCIADADKVFCEKHQAAYRAAIQSFQELLFFWQDTEKTQQELLGEEDSTATKYRWYLTGSGSLSISEEAIRDHIRALHAVFIRAIVHHFNRRRFFNRLQPVLFSLLRHLNRDGRWPVMAQAFDCSILPSASYGIPHILMSKFI